jgi:hypothetical protein
VTTLAPPYDLLAATVVPHGDNAGVRLADMLHHPNGPRWVGWALRQPVGFWPIEFEAALAEVARELDRRRRRA